MTFDRLALDLEMPYFIGHDLGTGGNKAVLLDATGKLLASSFTSYPLHHPHSGWAEQDPEDWWQAVASCTRAIIKEAEIREDEVAGVCFAGQMLALVPMGANAVPTRPAISWLDHRAEQQAQHLTRRFGGPRVVGALVGAAPTGKDIVPKIAWIRENEPDVFRQTQAFCDATGYLVARASGKLLIDQSGAAGTGIVSTRTRNWSRLLATLSGFPLRKMPPVRKSTEVVGGLQQTAAAELGLAVGTPVVMGMADIPSAAVGSGAVEDRDAHIYLGTSSWLGVTVSRPRHAPRNGIASVAAADPSMFLMIGESETAGACVDWFMQHVGLGAQGDGAAYAGFDKLVGEADPGAGGLLFLPWMFGERSPVPDTAVRGAYVNLSLEHHRAHLARAVYEGVAYNLRWILDAVAAVGVPCETLRAIGGGALSGLWLQIIADVTGRRIDQVCHPQSAGAIGCALTAAVALGALPSMRAIKQVISVERSFHPQPAHRSTYDRLYGGFRAIYPAASATARRLGGGDTGGK